MLTFGKTGFGTCRILCCINCFFMAKCGLKRYTAHCTYLCIFAISLSAWSVLNCSYCATYVTRSVTRIVVYVVANLSRCATFVTSRITLIIIYVSVLYDINGSLDTAVFLNSNAVCAPITAAKELNERKENSLLILSSCVLVLTTCYSIDLICIDYTVTVFVVEYKLRVRNTAELIIIGINGGAILCIFTVVINVPVTVNYGTSVSGNAGHIRDDHTVFICGIFVDRTDDHTCITVCRVLIVTANIVINVKNCGNVTVLKMDACVSRALSACGIILTYDTTASNVRGTPKRGDLIGAVHGNVCEGSLKTVFVSIPTNRTYDTAVAAVIHVSVAVEYRDILEGGAICISCDNTGSGIFSLRGEVVYSKILYSTAGYVCEQAHAFVVTVTLHLPVVLVEAGDLVTVTVKGTGEAVEACGNRNAGLFILSISAVVTNGIEDYVRVIFRLFVTEINISQKLYDLAAEGISFNSLCHTSDDSAESCELVCIGDRKLGCISIVPGIIAVAFPLVFLVHKGSDLREACQSNRYVTSCGIVRELVVCIEIRYACNVDHSNGLAVLYVIEIVVTHIETGSKKSLESYNNRSSVVLSNFFYVNVDCIEVLIFVSHNVTLGFVKSSNVECNLCRTGLKDCTGRNNCTYDAVITNESYVIFNLVFVVDLNGCAYNVRAVERGELCTAIIVGAKAVALARKLRCNKVYVNVADREVLVLIARRLLHM